MRAAAVESESWVHLTMKSGNAKTGPMPVSTTEEPSCAPDCPFKDDGCYAEYGPLALHWRKVSAKARGMSWETFCEAVRSFADGLLWRHNQAGDLPHTKGVIDVAKARKLAAANVGKRGFTYTHHNIELGKNLRTIWAMNEMGFTVNLSANNLEHADELAATKLPVVVVLPHDQMTNLKTPGGRQVVVCPAVVRDDTNCVTCGLCADRERTSIIGFPAHASGWKKVEIHARLTEEETA